MGIPLYTTVTAMPVEVAEVFLFLRNAGLEEDEADRIAQDEKNAATVQKAFASLAGPDGKLTEEAARMAQIALNVVR